jgi:hypothetical protein
MGMMEQEAWHPQRSLPELSVNILISPRTLPPPVHLLVTIHMERVQAARDLHRHCDLCASGHPRREISNCIDSPAGHGGGAWWAGGGAVQMRQCHGSWELVCGYAGAWAREVAGAEIQCLKAHLQG